MTLPQPNRRWIYAAIAVPIAVVVAAASISNWNWLRDPLERQVENRTGRSFDIGGDLEIELGWPAARIRMAQVRFANPPWAEKKDMFTAHNVNVDLALAPLLRRAIVLEHVALDRASVDLEKSADGRKNWLLDRRQRDTSARVDINHLTVIDGRLYYVDPGEKTRLEARLATRPDARGDPNPLEFDVSGRYKGQPLKASGSGGRLLSLRDSSLPYPIDVSGKVGPTSARARGHITNLLKFSIVDLDIRLEGRSLAELYPVLGIVFPDTPPYISHGRLRHEANWWRYEKFKGKVGSSDLSGTLKVDRGGKRPLLTATLASRHLDLADLGPLVGATPSATAPAPTRPAGRVLPDAPFRTARWDRMDADVRLTVQSIKRANLMPLTDLSTHLVMRDAVVTLDPLEFGVAGGALAGTVKLDGKRNPIKARAELDARKISLVRLIPTARRDKTSFGDLNGKITLKGEGDTIADMLGSADGHVGLVLNGGQISKLMMETVSLHLLEMLQLKLTGDESIRIRCGIADFGVKGGQMQTNALVLDTDIVRIDGRGTINLGNERLDLTVVPQTKKLSLVALRSPIHVEGTFSQPDVSLDTGRLALRGLGAVALGAINPALALMPLIDPGRSKDSDCARLIAETRSKADS